MQSIKNQTAQTSVYWNTVVSDVCKELIEVMLHEDTRLRFTVDEALAHPWFLFN